MEWTALLACAFEICLLLLLLLLFICWNFWFIAWMRDVARVSLVSSSSSASSLSSSTSTSHIERNQMKILYKHLPFFFRAVLCSALMRWANIRVAVYFCGKIVITYNFDTLGWILKCNQRKMYRFSSSLYLPSAPEHDDDSRVLSCRFSFDVGSLVFKNMNINGINMIINTWMAALWQIGAAASLLHLLLLYK